MKYWSDVLNEKFDTLEEVEEFQRYCEERLQYGLH